MLGKIQRYFYRGAQCPELPPQHLLHKHFFFHPQRHSSDKAPPAPRHKSMICFQQPLKLQQRLIIKYHGGKLIERNAGLRQYILNGLCREGGILFYTGKTFLLGGRNNVAVDEQRCRTVVIKCRYAQDNFSQCLKYGVNKRRQRRGAC